MISAIFLLLTTPDFVLADYNSFPVEERPYYRYIYVPDGYSPEVVEYVILSFSTTPSLDRCKPIRLTQSYLRVDLRTLGWETGRFIDFIKHYPYHKSGNPLVIRGDWLVNVLVDDTVGGLGRELMFGKMKTAGEWLEALNVKEAENVKLGLRIGHIEGQSGVANQPERLIKFLETLGGYASITYDYRSITPENSPFDNLTIENPRADASEIIVGIRRNWRTGSGSTQAYLLADGKGSIQNEAPIEIVEDHTRTGGLPTIRNSISCFSCHSVGLIPVTENKLASVIELGVELFEKDKGQVAADFLSSTEKSILRAQEDFSEALLYITGMTPGEWQKAYSGHLRAYRGTLDIDQVAKELGVPKDHLVEVLAFSYPTGNLAALVHGGKITREYFEDIYLELHFSIRNQ